ncbi:MAG: hypothetical protein OK454_08470 [Thaumarchaeota archaeon]|nr:hypothetical protein [Nitrososphaerota archaeon]
MRKNVRDSDDKGGDADVAAGDDAVGGVVPGGPDDAAAKKNKKAKVGLPWEPSSFYSQEVPEREDEEDEEEEEMNHITLQRLRKADERTKVMTREEYVTWSEYRQASFTYRKGKRFREWASMDQIVGSKPNDDVMDILGFLTCLFYAFGVRLTIRARWRSLDQDVSDIHLIRDAVLVAVLIVVSLQIRAADEGLSLYLGRVQERIPDLAFFRNGVVIGRLVTFIESL